MTTLELLKQANAALEARDSDELYLLQREVSGWLVSEEERGTLMQLLDSMAAAAESLELEGL